MLCPLHHPASIDVPLRCRTDGKRTNEKCAQRVLTNPARIPAAAVLADPPKATRKRDERPAARCIGERSYEGHSRRSLRRKHRIPFKYGVYRHPRSMGWPNHSISSPCACTMSSHATMIMPKMIHGHLAMGSPSPMRHSQWQLRSTHATPISKIMHAH